jgi:hypothetical protein
MIRRAEIDENTQMCLVFPYIGRWLRGRNRLRRSFRIVAQMIISASYKTDIPAFHGAWYLRRIAAGSVTVAKHDKKAEILG